MTHTDRIARIAAYEAELTDEQFRARSLRRLFETSQMFGYSYAVEYENRIAKARAEYRAALVVDTTGEALTDGRAA